MQLSLVAALCSIIITAEIYPANADEGTRLNPVSIKINTPQSLVATFQTVSPHRTKDPDSLSRGNCPEDLNADSLIDVTELLQVVGDWGIQGGASDIDGSGVVDTGDLLPVIGAWGQCV